MTSLVIFALEGVLQSEGGRPVEAGCRLYRTLRNGLLYQTGVISAADETTTRRFLDRQHMPVPAFIEWHIPASAFTWAATCSTIRRAYPYDIDAVIVPDPAIASALYYEGFRTLLFTDPRYSRPEHRPDAPPPQANAWHQLAGELAEDHERAAGDDRISR